jgi:cytosine deaminase
MTALTIVGARLLDAEGLADVTMADGRITGVARSGGPVPGERLDADGGVLLPGFVECHFHPDKALTRDRLGPVGSAGLRDAMARGAAVKRAFTADDVAERATAVLRSATAHGITTMRAQVDVDTVVGLTGLEAMLTVRERFASVLDLQLVAFPQEGIVRDPGVDRLLAAALELGADMIGGGPANEDSPEDAPEHLRRVFDLAEQAGCGIDIHIDLSEDPRQQTLALLAQTTLDRGMRGRVTASHCCALAAYDEDLAARTITLVREAEIQICVCPMGNLLLGSEDDEPRGRGASRPKALLRAGVNVAIGSDNVNDMWFRFGRLDPAEVAMVSCLAMGMRTDDEVRVAVDMVTTRAARFAGVPAQGIAPGAPADLVLFSATTMEDVLRGASSHRRTIKAGRVVAGSDTRSWTDAVWASPASA